MPNRKVELAMKYLTAPQVRKRLGLSRYQLDLRIERGVFPRPTYTDVSGVRYFDENWVRIAQAILQSSTNPKRSSIEQGGEHMKTARLSSISPPEKPAGEPGFQPSS